MSHIYECERCECVHDDRLACRDCDTRCDCGTYYPEGQGIPVTFASLRFAHGVVQAYDLYDEDVCPLCIEAYGDEIHQCRGCKRHFHVDADLMEGGLCTPCQQDYENAIEQRMEDAIAEYQR